MALREDYRVVNWYKRFNRGAQILLGILLITGINFMATRHFERFDLTHNHLYSLSPETKAEIKKMEATAKVIVTLSNESPEEDLRLINKYVRRLLKEYEYASIVDGKQKIEVEFVDIYKEIKKADAIARTYGIDQPNVILFTSGDKRRQLLPTDIVELREGIASAFKGEKAFTSALMEVTGNRRQKIYFLTGHGEMSLDDVDPRRGLSQLKQQLRERNFTLDTLDLALAPEVPEEADLLVVASPQGPLMEQEVEKLRKFLGDSAGRIIVLIDPWRSHGLGDLFYEWGILTDDMLIVDTGSDYQDTNGDLLIRRFAEHPITDILLKNQIPIIMGLTRPVRFDLGSPLDERLSTVQLMATSKNSWAERSYKQVKKLEDLKYDKESDLLGPVSIAAVSERKVSSNLGISLSGGRLVTFGNSDMVANQRIGSIGNFMLFMNTINWCLGRDRMLAIPPRPVEKYQLPVSRLEMNTIGLVLLIIPGLLAVMGIAVGWIRQH